MVLRGSKIKGTTKQNFLYGGLAGTCSRTMVAPLDRIKILMQTSKQTLTLPQMSTYVLKKEGLRSLWKGNVLNCARVFPYSAFQFGIYDVTKSFFDTPLSITERLSCGTVAGVCATTLTHPIDVIRHRLILEPSITTFQGALKDVIAERGYYSLFKGYGSTVSSLTPFIAINFCAFDSLKNVLQWTSIPGVLGMGAGSALISQSLCYPLDTVRRRMQLRHSPYKHGIDALVQIIRTEGIGSLYAGMLANALKIVPNNSIRFLVYELCRRELM
tara:strand:+ start:737 stop:1552 length:816 start_codon:yes stop_codon:yes gene_type:complete